MRQGNPAYKLEALSIRPFFIHDLLDGFTRFFFPSLYLIVFSFSVIISFSMFSKLFGLNEFPPY